MIEIFEKELDYKIIMPKCLTDINLSNICIFDIETTGLSRIESKVVLVGFVEIFSNKLKITQFFSNSLSDESDLLKLCIEKFRGKDLLISYNGNAFDIPFLNSRFNKHNIDYYISKNLSLDLLKIVRKNKNYLNLENYKLKTVEKFLGIKRTDTISGRESVELYYEFLNTKNPKLKNKILLHNFEDIKYLYEILKILDYCNIQSIYSEYFFKLNLVNNNLLINFNSFSNSTLYLNKVSIKNSEAKLEFNLSNNSKSLITTGYSEFEFVKPFASIKYNSHTKHIVLILPIITLKLNENKHYFFNVNEFYNNNIFNKLTSSEKEKILFKYNKDILYFNIFKYLDNNLNTIINKIVDYN
ncbi:ribonuclease H-like domain-containing protein [Helicovermis profundi]|uniref:YprB ribonuclease H-like domain-containing protein n=1 Tax=Helicovermis profundi TaxID=3065157 RepID=A0AAU9EB13_9FIRM|nr:hypothetical protein HLPR_23230 [Clostridia bacterium S502]